MFDRLYWKSGAVWRKYGTEFAAEPADCVPGPDAGPAEKLFFANDGPVVHKWHHYLPVYDRYFSPFRNRDIRFLEIGVAKGGSLKMWREFFGAKAIIAGIDIDPKCGKSDGVNDCIVRIGSQDDPAFLKSLVAELGGEVDIVLDDGSHRMRHINASFDALFPLLADGGLYVVEDLQCAYWTKFGGGYRRRGTFIETAKSIVDDMHHWWHNAGPKVPACSGQVAAIHFHDSIVVIEKSKNLKRPVQSRQGNEQDVHHG